MIKFFFTHRLDPYRYYHSESDLGVMAMKKYFIFPKAPGWKPHYQRV